MNITLFILIALFQTLNNEGQIVVHENTSRLNIGLQTSILEDEDGCYTIEDIVQPACQRKFIQSKQQTLTFSPNDSYYWINFKIRSYTDKQFVIFIDEAKIKSIDLYYKAEGTKNWNLIRNGYSVLQNQKALVHNFQVFPINLSNDTQGDFYIRLQPRLMPLSISIESKADFFEIRNTRYNLVLGLVIGVIFFVGLNNLSIYFSSGRSLRFLYFLTSFSFVLYSILFNGHIFLASTFVYQNLLRFVIPLTFISQFLVILYGTLFLEVRKYAHWLYVWSIFFLTILVGLTFLSFFTNEYYIIMCANITGLLSLMNCLLMGVLTWRKNSSIYKSNNLIYCCSYILFLFFFLLEIGHIYLGWNYFFIVRFIDIGFLCEAIGLSIALSVRAGIDKERLVDARDTAQRENLLLISKQNQILEVRVRHRTFELEEKTKIAEQLSNEYKLQSEKLREVNLVKDRLFSIISHDLRSPLQQLHSILNLTDKGKLSDEEIRGLLYQVRMHIGVNIQLTDNLLFWARSQMSGAKVYNQYFSLFSIVETKLQFFKHGADRKKIITSNRIHHDLKIYSDENIIALVIHNLLANAIKFCENGDTIIVGNELKENEIVIYVSDTGVGMTSEDIRNILGSNIFTKYGTANEKGTGLGLKICKDLIQQINGRLWIESQQGIGTTFYFAIPEKPHMQVINNRDNSLQASA